MSRLLLQRQKSASKPDAARHDTRGARGGPGRLLLDALFHAYIVIALLGGVLLLVLSSSGSVHDLLRDLGIGVIVSAFVVVSIEWRAGLTLRTEIATDVLEAVYQRLVPPVIYNQVRDSVFRSDVIRRGWELKIRVVNPSDPTYSRLRELGRSEDLFLIDSTVTYQLENLHDGSAAFTVRGWIDLDVPGREIGIPRFTSLEIGTTVWDATALSEERARKLYAGEECPPLEDGLTLSLMSDKEIAFAKEIALPRDALTRVRYQVRRAIRAPGTYVLSSSSPADGITIEIEGTPELQFEVRPPHSQSDQIAQVGATGRWEFPYGILPWQGIQIVSHAARALGRAGISGA